MRFGGSLESFLMLPADSQQATLAALLEDREMLEWVAEKEAWISKDARGHCVEWYDDNTGPTGYHEVVSSNFRDAIREAMGKSGDEGQ
jgi:hypothetical protein